MLAREIVRYLDQVVSQFQDRSPPKGLCEGEQESRARVTSRVKWMSKPRQSFPQTETFRQDFSRTPRPAGFLEERFDFRCMATMPSALHRGECAGHYLVRRG